MEEERRLAKLWFSMAVLFAVISCTTAVQTIYPDQTIRDGETLVSPEGNFELGFFTDCTSRNRYVGIWSKKSSCRQLISILNWDAPLTNKSGELSVTLQGSMVIRYSNGHVIWSSGKSSEGKLLGQLLDNGIFVIREENCDDLEKNPSRLCLSSDFPGDTYKGVSFSFYIWNKIRDYFYRK